MSVPSKDVTAPDKGASQRERLISAARASFLQRGFRNVSMDELARSVGMSKRTLYEMFPSKISLIEAVIEEKLAQLEGDLERLTSAGGAASFACAREALACIHRHAGEIQPAFMHDVKTQAPEIFSLIKKRRASLIEKHFERLIQAGQTGGSLRQDIPSRFLVEMLLCCLDGVVTPEKMEDFGMSPKEGLGAVLSVVFDGLFTESGRGGV